MKKILSVIFIAMLVFVAFSAVCFADTTNYCRYTDIVAYIDGNPIKSYNISGSTGIIAEDLPDYKFNVRYNEKTRELMINYDKSKEITATYIPPKNNKKIGTFAEKIYPTDIVVRVYGNEVKGYNIGGKTVIFIDDLLPYGDIVWDGEKREISFTYQKPWECGIKTGFDVEKGVEIDGFSMDFNYENGEYTAETKNFDYLDFVTIGNVWNDNLYFKFCLYQRVDYETSKILSFFNENMTENYDHTTVNEDMTTVNKHIKAYVNGEPVEVVKIVKGKGNGHEDFTVYFDCTVEERNLNGTKITIDVDCKK